MPADQGAAKSCRLRIAVDREHRRSGVEFGVPVEQDRALAIPRPVVLLPHAAGLNNPDRPVEAVEMVKDLAEAFRPVGELRTGDPVEPAPEIGRAHNRCSDSGLVGAARLLAAPSKPRSRVSD